MSGTARARHYPQPRPAGEVLAELAAEYCEHDGVPGRCPMCRAAEASPDPPPPTTPRPDLTTVADTGDEDDQDPRNTPWWQR